MDILPNVWLYFFSFMHHSCGLKMRSILCVNVCDQRQLTFLVMLLLLLLQQTGVCS